MSGVWDVQGRARTMKVGGRCPFESITHRMGGIKLVVSSPWLQRRQKKKKRGKTESKDQAYTAKKEYWRNVQIESTEAKILRHKPLSGTQEGDGVQVPRKSIVIPGLLLCPGQGIVREWSDRI